MSRPARPFLICSNHASHIDTPSLMAALNKDIGSFRQFAMIAAIDYFSSGSARNYDNCLQLIKISRRASRESLQDMFAQCHKYADAGINLIIYPEGTRSRDGHIQPFRRGAALLALELGIPILPAHISGSFKVLPKKTFFPKPGKIAICFGQPIDPSEYHAKDSKRLCQDIADAVHHLMNKQHPS